MYRIEHNGSRPRVVSESGISATDFAQLAIDLGIEPHRARKAGRVAARQATRRERVETRWNGKETENEAVPGDWIITALSADDVPLRDDSAHLNVYVVTQDRFGSLYEPLPTPGATPYGAIFQPRGYVEAVRITGGFEIKAPWGEMQYADDGWLLLSGSEVYGNHRDTFDETYDLLD
jgi:hypothetical protein